MTFAKRLRRARETAGLNQTELARRLKVTPQSVQLWESEGEKSTTPRTNRVREIAHTLGVREDWLLFGRGEGLDNVPPRWAREVPLFRLSVIGTESNQERHPPMVLCPTPCSPSAFAVQLDESCLIPGALPGDTLFIDPDVPPSDGDWVITLSETGDGGSRIENQLPDNRKLVGTVIYLGRNTIKQIYKQ